MGEFSRRDLLSVATSAAASSLLPASSAAKPTPLTFSRSKIEQWGIFELSLEGSADGNPFVDNQFSANFSQGDRSIKVTGFYDGKGIYKVRFMPDTAGRWTYRTSSNLAELSGHEGGFEVEKPRPGNHGPVRVANTYHFSYADGTPFKQIGTTCYAWAHQTAALEEQTLRTLRSTPFNKLRMSIFPKHFPHNENEPEFYPFPLLSRGSSKFEFGVNSGKPSGWSFDFSRFDPNFFHHFERRIADLQALGIEADVILFLPYDRWGFSTLTAEQDDRYVRYVVARLAAFRNVWWSVANEFDNMPQKSMADWDRYFQIIQKEDPYGHLRSIHNCFAFYDHSKPWVTHCSVQRTDLSQTLVWRKRYKKPVVVDECGYEGDLPDSWGCLSGREMVHRFWEGTVNGGYVGHGDTFKDPNDVLWWSKGGTIKGESVPRLAFLRRILESGPAAGLEPIPSTLPYIFFKAGGVDKVTLKDLANLDNQQPFVLSGFAGVHQPHEYYLTYFGGSQPSEIQADVPAGEQYQAEIVDTWEMTITRVAEKVMRGASIPMPVKPYQAIILKRLH